MPKVSLDFNTRKEIKVLMLKGEIGKSSYDLAVENLLFSGTLEEWIETFSTPENYITRLEFQKVTQAEYDELVAQEQLIPNAFYLITDDATYDEIMDAISNLTSRVSGDEDDIGSLETRVDDLEYQQNINTGNIEILQGQITSKVEKTSGTFTFSSSSKQVADLILNHQGIKIYYTVEDNYYKKHYDVMTFVVRAKSDYDPTTLKAYYIDGSGNITAISDNTLLNYEYFE